MIAAKFRAREARPLVVYVTGIHLTHAESRIFVASAPSQVHSEEIPVFSFEAVLYKRLSYLGRA